MYQPWVGTGGNNAALAFQRCTVYEEDLQVEKIKHVTLRSSEPRKEYSRSPFSLPRAIMSSCEEVGTDHLGWRPGAAQHTPAPGQITSIKEM